MMKILIIGDSWIDLLPKIESNKHGIAMVCVPGSTMYTIQNHLEIELLLNDYNLVICLCGCNGVDNSLFINYPQIELIRNDMIPDKYRQSSGYPNEKGIAYCVELITNYIPK